VSRPKQRAVPARAPSPHRKREHVASLALLAVLALTPLALLVLPASCGGGFSVAPLAADASPEEDAGDVLIIQGREPDADASSGKRRDAGPNTRPAPPDGDNDDGKADGGEMHDVSDAGEAGPACASGAAPADGGCIANTSGVFVSATGTNAPGFGTMKKPYASISYALANLDGANAVYVCGSGASYSDQITVTAPVSLYGGLTCTSLPWTYSRAAVPQVMGTSPSSTLEVADVVGAVDVEDMAFFAPDANPASPGESSIAVFVSESTGVTFKRVTMTSGAGSTGATGSAGSAWTAPQAPTGGSAVGATGGAPAVCPCGSTAGTGGTATPTGGSQGTSGGPLVAAGTGGDGQGGEFGTPLVAACNAGQPGATAPAESGGVGQDGGGVLSSVGWDGGTGAAGAPGSEGQGAGGGSGGLSVLTTAGGGSGGGCGGCGGGPGGGGGAGGSSFALASVASAVTLDACTLTGGKGGTGGTGGAGQAGQPGGLAGAASSPGCTGGAGGNGGQAGGGGGGGGGYSVAVAYTIAEPTLINGTTTTGGTAGSGGPAGTGGTPAATPGSPGVAMGILGL